MQMDMVAVRLLGRSTLDDRTGLGECPVVKVNYIQRSDGWLTRNFQGPDFNPPEIPESTHIEERARETNATGEHPLWVGYKTDDKVEKHSASTRRADQVRTNKQHGLTYAWLAANSGAKTIVEFGTAFGVSGMFWLAGLKNTGGHLYTFEPNEIWARLARANLESISPKFTLTNGTFEDNAENVLDGTKIDIAFIDAIHTSVFVNAQFEIVKRYSRPGAIVLFDDIRFSADMKSCWRLISRSDAVKSSAEIGSRVGIVEL